MEKLKLVLVYRFWILCSVSLLLPPIGWWMASDALIAEIEDRTNSLESTYKSIPKGSGAPNQKWIGEVTRRNQLRVASNTESASRLWQEQQPLMDWPDDIKDVMARCPYRSKIKDFGAAQDVPDLYIHDYPDEIRKLWLIVDPLDDEAGNLAGKDSKRKVKFEMSDIPRVPATKWEDLPPSWMEMWDVQEDIWLMKELLRAISRVNAGDFDVIDSYIKQIVQIRLFGGDRIVDQPAGDVDQPAGDGTKDGGPGGGGPDIADNAPGGQGSYPGPRKRRGPISSRLRGSGIQSQTKGFSADFSLSEEFNNVEFAGSGKTDKRSTGSGTPFGPKSEVTTSKVNSADPNADAKAQGAPNAPKKQERYVDELGVPYRTRGFYLKVVIDHRRVPELLVELANAKWPIEFVRVQQASRNNQGSGGDLMGGPNENTFAKQPTGTANKKDDKQSESERMQSLAKAALADPNLATVVVAGLMMIYDPPKNYEQAIAAAPAGAAPGSATQPLPTRGAAPPATGTSAGQPATNQPAPTSPEVAEKYPVKQLEKLAASVVGRRQIGISKPKLNPLVESDKMWGKIESRVVSSAFDVKKTDSLVSPLSGIISIKGAQITFGDFKTEAEARASNLPKTKDREEFTYHFAWQKNKWVFKSGLNKDLVGALKSIGDNRPGWPLKKFDWPFTPIKKSGQVGRFDDTIVLDE